MCTREGVGLLPLYTSISRYVYCHCPAASLYMSACTWPVPLGPLMKNWSCAQNHQSSRSVESEDQNLATCSTPHPDVLDTVCILEDLMGYLLTSDSALAVAAPS